MAAIFYQSWCKDDEVFYNAFSEQDENCDKLFHLLPSFRTELLDEAAKKGLEGCNEYAKEKERKRERERLRRAAGRGGYQRTSRASRSSPPRPA